jgi:hypothetical protein
MRVGADVGRGVAFLTAAFPRAGLLRVALRVALVLTVDFVASVAVRLARVGFRATASATSCLFTSG